MDSRTSFCPVRTKRPGYEEQQGVSLVPVPCVRPRPYVKRAALRPRCHERQTEGHLATIWQTIGCAPWHTPGTPSGAHKVLPSAVSPQFAPRISLVLCKGQGTRVMSSRRRLSAHRQCAEAPAQKSVPFPLPDTFIGSTPCACPYLPPEHPEAWPEEAKEGGRDRH